MIKIELKNFGDIVTLTKQRVRFNTENEAVDNVIRNGINQAYLEIQKVDPLVSTAFGIVINGIITLPEDINEIISISPKLLNSERVGNTIIVNDEGIDQVTITYSRFATPMIDDNDIPEIAQKYWYSLSSYGAYAYYLFKKKSNEAQNFLTDYTNNLAMLKPTSVIKSKVKNFLAAAYKGE